MTWTWELYEDGSGEVPKALLAYFVELMPPAELPADGPQPVLTLSESNRLQFNLRRLCEKGLASLMSDNFEKLEDDLYEFRLTKSEHNPRFILTPAFPQRFVVLHAFMKKYDRRIRDSDKEPARQRLRELKEREGR
ncbi:type II toxin-antitoxin system RelE/ParE family toxin [Kamptonema formosum]|uniref:type II toxin-antitoxin system RelE/ParE family toxin n=1 Tax=Kamptonema formosum TaxID=331992 RepID=UPI000347CC37|nr:type II toxin-antitoxin system RelE/ParE family toxin [Oscillatoria sp. PCC 10802]